MKAPLGPAPVARDRRPHPIRRACPARPARRWPLLLTFAASLLGSGACHSAQGDALVLWAMGSEGDAAARLVRDFEAENPGLSVRVQSIPWSAAHEKLLTAFVGGSMPDAFQAGNTWLPELRELGALEPLDARLAASRVLARDDFFPGILDTNVLDGTTWGVPWYVDTRLIFYRTDLLAAAGVSSFPTTRDAWRDAMSRVKQHAATRRGAPEGHAILLPMREWQVPVILALQDGAELLRDHERFGNFRSEPVRRAFAWYLELFAAGLAPRESGATSGNVYQDFGRGAFAFYVTGPWNLGEMSRRLPRELQDQWDTAPLPGPRADQPGSSLAGGASLVVSATSHRKDDAWKLVEFLAAPERQAALERSTGDLPAARSAWRSLGLAESPRTRAFYQQLQSVRAAPKIPEWEQIATLVGRHVEAMIRADESLDGGLTALDRDVDQVLEKRRWLLDHDLLSHAATGSRASPSSTHAD